jgi:neutral ceramidase
MRALLIVCLVAACGDDGMQQPPDAGVVTTDKCDYVPLSPTAQSGGTVTAAQLQAGAAEQILDIPVGTALGGYTARAGFLGSAGVVDTRKIKIAGTFNPSIGRAAAPRVKALALTAGDETVVILKVDLIYIYEGMVFDLEQRLGAQFAGKVIITSSHSHSAWAQHYFGGPLQLGGGVFRELVYNRFLDAFEATAKAALAARRDAKIGIFFDGNFDPTNQVNHDRRTENDMLPGGNVKDNHFYMIRVDGMDGAPIAALPVFGEHGTLNSEDNPLASSDAPGAMERVLQEQFSSQVVVMHLQSAAGDNSPSGHGGIDCNVHPGKMSDPCFSWATEEGHGRAAASILMDAWTAAGANMQSSVEMEMVSRSIEVGPKPETFSIRGGALSYAPFDLSKTPDGKIYDTDGTTLLSPIDEFNAPVGAALCQTDSAMFPAAEIDGDQGIMPYGSCLRLDTAGEILGPIFQTDFGVDETSPVCEETRTTISALRINDYVFGTMPGELTVMLATYMRTQSPVPADHTVLLGYSQGHVGYMLRPEDWMMGGYEPSVTFWGPLAAEHIGEELIQLMGLVMTPEREDGTTAGTTRVAVPTIDDGLDIDNPAPNAGTIPATIPAETWSRVGTPVQAQPDAQIPRISGVATFTWIGDDPSVQTPRVTLQSEVSAGVYADVTRKSGRVVEDQEIIIAYTPSPLQRTGPQTHVWVAEWQAVPWLGSPDGDTLDMRGNVKLGNYRFHVVGSTWTLDSSPFQVVPGGLAVTAARATTINIGVRWYAPKGWRLMDMDLMSNQPVPVKSQSVKVELLDATNAIKMTYTTTTDAAGNVSVADVAGSTQVRVTDASLNVQTVAIP